MGVKQSKRSVDITETSTKGEIEGFGNEGKVEKIIDGVMEKVAANGHVENDLQNGGEAHQNGLEPVQNGEVAEISVEKVVTKDNDEATPEGTVNGQVEANGEVNGEIEKGVEEGKKNDDKKEKKKEKKERGVKKKFSLRNFSFSKKDKNKPTKDDVKSPEKVDETPAENAATVNGEKDETVKLPEGTVDVSNVESSGGMTVVAAAKDVLNAAESEIERKSSDVANAVKEVVEDFPPPLPVSPPPSEPVDAQTTDSPAKSSTGILDTLTGKLEEVTSSVSNTLTETLESTEEVLKDAEKMAIETGKQIEEKATSLLKTVEKRAEESMRTAAQKVEDVVENTLGLGQKVAAETDKDIDQETKDLAAAAIADASETLSPDTEETVEKSEETGAGESLADVPKEMADHVTEASPEAGSPDSLESPKTLLPPPPPVEAAAE